MKYSEPVEGADLSRCMKWMMTSHVRRYYRHYDGSGHAWTRYVDEPFEDKELEQLRLKFQEVK